MPQAQSTSHLRPATSMSMADTPSLGTRLLDLVLTTDRAQRVRLTHTLIASFIFAVDIALMAYTIHQGLTDERQGTVLSLLMSATCIGYYVILRSGLNLRFKDPALTMPQILTALTWVCAAYAVVGVTHAGTLILYALVMVFGIFNMSRRNAALASAYAVVAMGATMYYLCTTDPRQYPPRIEAVYFVLVLFIIPTIGALSAQINQMRSRLRTQKVTLSQQKAELEQAMVRIQELATRDELTGLINRREMAALIHQHAQQQKRKAIGFSVAMIDLDHFKRINDTWGHQAGDAVLREFARQARLLLRETDVVARWGGEEFMVLLPETSPGHPGMAIERLREHLKRLPVCPQAPDLRISFSAGVTAFRADESIDEAIARADHALYDAKQAGRNCTVFN